MTATKELVNEVQCVCIECGTIFDLRAHVDATPWECGNC